MNDHDNPGGEPLLAGYAAMSDHLTARGFRTSKSTLSKLGAPSANAELPADERLPIEGYWGILPIAKPSRLIDWAYRRLRPSRGEPSPIVASAETAPLAPAPPAPAPKTTRPPTPPPPRKRGPAKVQPAGAAAEAR
jgi:hypothetical protein